MIYITNLKREKQKWIINYIETHDKHIDMLNEAFVDEYVEKFDSKVIYQPYGANTCRELSRLLGEMYNNNLLIRFIIGLHGCDVGMPKWYYCYKVNKLKLNVST